MNHIAPTRKSIANTSVILYGSAPQERMVSFGPKCLFKVKDKTLLDRHFEIVNKAIVKPEFLICSGFQIERLINKGYKLVENQISSTECEDIRLALNLCTHKNILLIDQAAYYDTVYFKYDESFIVAGEGEEEISVNESNYLEALTFNENIKWKGITFIHERDYNLLKSCLDTRNYTNRFLFELLNSLVDLKMKIRVQKSEGKIVTTPKILRDLQ